MPTAPTSPPIPVPGPAAGPAPSRWAPGWHWGLPGWQRMQQPVARGWHGLQPHPPLVSTRAEVHLQHLAALVPPPALASATQSVPCPSAELWGQGLVLDMVGIVPWQEPWQGLDVCWGPMLLALCRLGTAGLRCRMGPGCWEGFSALVRGRSHWRGVGKERVPWGQTGMRRETQQGCRAWPGLQRCRLLREMVQDFGLQGREGQSGVGGIVGTLGLAPAFACSPCTLPKSARPWCTPLPRQLLSGKFCQP